MKYLSFFISSCVFLVSCKPPAEPSNPHPIDTIPPVSADTFKPVFNPVPSSSYTDSIITGSVDPRELLAFSKTLIGTPYLYDSTYPAKGFYCSGFITYVFNSFNIHVPRSSIDFTDKGKEVPLENALPGDLILFTGTDTLETHVGHM